MERGGWWRKTELIVATTINLHSIKRRMVDAFTGNIHINYIYMQHCFRSSLIINIFALFVKWGKMSITNAPKSDDTSKVYSANTKYLIGQNLFQVYVKTGMH